MKTFFIVLLLILQGSFSFAKSNAIKLGELARSSDLNKEVLSLIPKTTKDWISLSEELLGPKKKFKAKTKKFTVESGQEETQGDLARYTYHLLKDGKKTRLGNESLAWVQISTDENYIFFEPLTVMNTKDWSTQDLTSLVTAPGYFKILKYSPLNKKIIVADFDCAMDCDKADKYRIWEISLD